MIAIDLFKAIRAGKQLKEPKVWSNGASLSNVLATILTFSVGAAKMFGLDLPVTDDQLLSLSGGLAVVLGVINSVVHVATNKESGI